MLLSIETCDMLIKLCCSSSKVHHAVDVVEQMCQSGLDVPVKSFHPVLHACERHCEFDLVGPIYSMIRQYKLIPNGDTFKSMISLYVRMKDFEGAYKLLTDAAEINEVPTASMYNAIMAGYFREKNNQRALMVLEQMDEANVKPDSETYHYLIANCECEGDIAKYLDDMRLAGIEPTKHTYMALINAYANISNFKLAKQVVLDLVVPSKVLNEIKSALVSALASNGQILDALDIYDQMKQANCNIEPKAAVHLIEHIESDGESKKLFQLLEELNGSSFWFDGCSRVLAYCVRYNITNSAIELLKQLKEKDESSTYFVIDMIYSNIWKAGSTNLKIGFELLHAIKEELHLHPSRTTLDFLLSSCVKAKDPDRAWLVWSEYEDAGLPYNVVTFLRMYQALLASGKDKAASKMLKKIPKDDRHISLIINSCKMANSTRESP